MSMTSRIAQLESDLALQRDRVTEEVARLRAIEVELEALRAGISTGGSLIGMSRTDAILTVLRRAGGTMTPSEVLGALRSAGRDDELRSVTATLDYLLKAGRVQRPSRGRYIAV